MAITQTVFGPLRGVWTENVAQDSGSEVVQTTISVNSATMHHVFGFLDVTPAAGTPIFDAVASIVNGHLRVTVVNSALPGNTGTWRLELWYIHSVQQAAGQGPATIHIVGNASAPSIASWPDTRYVFLDGDSGNDANIGFIDAPAGTIFTPAQAAAVAVRTTHRLEELRPLDGAGRKVVTLIKPRAGRVCYDHFVVGDGLGRDNRHLLHGYSAIITRGSDLTNSLVDRAQLGMVPAVTGPLPNGYFTIASLTPGVSGTAVGLTGAALTGWQLSRYRMHFEGVGGTVYSSLKWGDLAAVPDPTIALVWFIPGPVVPGDTARIEQPGVVLHSYFEAFDCNSAADIALPLEAAGIEIVGGQARLGTAVAGIDALYTHFVFDVAGTTSVSTAVGNILGGPYFNDETGIARVSYGLGIAGPSGITMFNDGTIRLAFSSFIDSGTGTAASVFSVNARTIDISGSVIQSLVLANGADYARYASCVFGDTVWNCYGDGRLEILEGAPVWLRQITLNPFSLGFISAPSDISINMVNSLWAPEAVTSGFILAKGFYTTRFDMDGIRLGAGVQFNINDTGTVNIPITYASLSVTGFEVEGERKVVCKRTGYGYPDNELPCPRGKVVQQNDTSPT